MDIWAIRHLIFDFFHVLKIMARLSNYKGHLNFQSNFEEMSKHLSSIKRVDPQMQKNLVMFLVGCFCFGRCVPFHIQAGRVLGIKCQLSSDDLSCKRNKEYIQTSPPLCSMIFFISLFVPHHACEDEIKNEISKLPLQRASQCPTNSPKTERGRENSYTKPLL